LHRKQTVETAQPSPHKQYTTVFVKNEVGN